MPKAVGWVGGPPRAGKLEDAGGREREREREREGACKLAGGPRAHACGKSGRRHEGREDDSRACGALEKSRAACIREQARCVSDGRGRARTHGESKTAVKGPKRARTSLHGLLSRQVGRGAREKVGGRENTAKVTAQAGTIPLVFKIRRRVSCAPRRPRASGAGAGRVKWARP